MIPLPFLPSYLLLLLLFLLWLLPLLTTGPAS